MPNRRRFKSKHTAAIYHCISRTISGEKLFDEQSKEMLRRHLHQVAEFSGVKVITYALMSNHFHILVKVAEQKEVSDTELLRRYKVLYPNPTKWNKARIEIIEAMFAAGGPNAEKLRQQLLARMGDVSQFMKTLKQRFTIWFNQNHNRFGPLWAERFTSTIIEGARNHHFALQMVAAYIDLNPFRAGMVKDPKDYRWCGYGEAEAIGGEMLKGLRLAVCGSENLSDKEVLATYRIGLFGKGTASKRGDSKAARIKRTDFQKVLDADGALTDEERQNLQERMGSLSHGGVIGSVEFVQEHLEEYRVKTNKRHQLEPRPLAQGNEGRQGQLFSMRRGL
jgi:REP element-mobilizing transposase RayT